MNQVKWGTWMCFWVWEPVGGLGVLWKSSFPSLSQQCPRECCWSRGGVLPLPHEPLPLPRTLHRHRHSRSSEIWENS